MTCAVQLSVEFGASALKYFPFAQNQRPTNPHPQHCNMMSSLLLRSASIAMVVLSAADVLLWGLFSYFPVSHGKKGEGFAFPLSLHTHTHTHTHTHSSTHTQFISCSPSRYRLGRDFYYLFDGRRALRHVLHRTIFTMPSVSLCISSCVLKEKSS